jgi:ABC-2 type transport system permease protein
MIFMSPALTMRLIAEEQKLGTLELLLTSPLREFEIVFGKFVAAFVMIMIMIGLSLYFVIVLFVYGDPDIGPLLSGLLGLTLYAAATISVGLFASALSSNQIVGLVVGSGILTALTIIDFVSARLSGLASQILDGFQLGASFSVFDLDSFGVAQGGHFADFARGIISFTDIAYYLSLTAVFLLLTVLVLEARRWR